MQQSLKFELLVPCAIIVIRAAAVWPRFIASLLPKLPKTSFCDARDYRLEVIYDNGIR